MEQIFLTVLNMSVAASVVIAVVLLARLLLRRAPKKWSYLLWSVVAFRLCCPVSLHSAFSIFHLKPLQGTVTPAAETAVTRANAITYFPDIVSPAVIPEMPAIPTTPVTPVIPVTPTPAAEAAAQSAPSAVTTLMWLAIWLWVAGMAVLIGYGVYSYVRMRRLVSDAVIVRDRVFETNCIRSPFILGMLRPRIYIPMGLGGEQLDYVLAHESFHLRRRDHVAKSFAYLLLAVHWFNPLVWLAFRLMSRDMEMSCDEKVLGLRDDANIAYSSTLLSFAAPVRFPTATPLCFGEGSVKSRIRNALNWRKPKIWASLLAAVLCVTALAACATNPSAPKIGFKPVSDLKPVVVPLVNDDTLVRYWVIDRLGPNIRGSGGPESFDKATSQTVRKTLESRTFVDDPDFRAKDGADMASYGPGDVQLLVDGTFYFLSTHTGEVLRGEERYRGTEPLTADELSVIREAIEHIRQRSQLEVTPKDDGVFRISCAGYTPELDLTVMLPENWKGRYSCESSSEGAIFYCRSARRDAVEDDRYWGMLFTIRLLSGLYPMNYHWGYNVRVLAAAADYTVVMEFPDELLDPNLLRNPTDAVREYMDMRKETEQVTVTLSDEMTAMSYNDANWAPGTVTVYRSSQLSGWLGSPVVCDEDASAALTSMLDGRAYKTDGVPQEKLDGLAAYTVVTDKATYAILASDGTVVKDGCAMAGALTDEEHALLETILDGSGRL